MRAWLLAVFLCVPASAEPLFPPLERLFGDGASELPTPETLELRDSIASSPSTEAIQRALRSPDRAMRLAAVRGMGESRDPSTIPHLAGVLMKLDETVETRAAAAVGLGRVGHPAALTHLLAALKDPSPEVRCAAALALRRSKAGGSATALEERLRKDPSWWVRYAAAVALGWQRKPFTAAALERAAREDPQWQVRMEAARALGELKTARAAEALSAPLSDVDAGVRLVAARALADLSTKASLAMLRWAAADEQDPQVRTVMAALLRRPLRAD